MEKFGASLRSSGSILDTRPKDDSGRTPVILPHKLTQIKEKVSSDLTDQSGNKMKESSIVSKMKLQEIEQRPPKVPQLPPKLSRAASTGSNITGPSGVQGGPPPPPGIPLPPPPPPPPPGGGLP